MAQHPVELDFDVADRQAFGTTYGRPNGLETRTELLKQSILRLPPHPDWDGDVTDWRANPFKDRNWQFQHHTLRWLSPLRWSALEGDEQARLEWVRIAHSWAETNLPPERRADEYAWKDMADGTRALELSLGSRLIGEQDRWFIPLLEAHRDWLLDEDNFVRGNHGLHQLTGLFVVSSVLKDTVAVQSCIKRLEDHFVNVFDEDGGNDEGSTNYHVLNMTWWNNAWSRLTVEGHEVPDQARKRLHAAGKALAHLTQPDAALPQIGDGTRRRVNRGSHPTVNYLESAGKAGKAPAETSFVMRQGYVIVRSGWGHERPLNMESHGVLRFGRPGGGHAHDDRGSLLIYSAGRRWLVDSGFHSYQTRDPIRQHLKSRAAHNLPIIKGLAYNPEAVVTLDHFEESEDYADALLTDHGYEGVTLTRRVLYLKGPDCWIVWDRAASPSPLTLVQHWHADVGITARVQDRGFELHDGDDTFTMSWLGSQSKRRRFQAKKGSLRGWIGTGWKTLEPGTLLTAESLSDQPELLLLAGSSAPRELAIVKSFLNSSGTLTIKLMRGPQVWQGEIASGSVKIQKLERSW